MARLITAEEALEEMACVIRSLCDIEDIVAVYRWMMADSEASIVPAPKGAYTDFSFVIKTEEV